MDIMYHVTMLQPFLTTGIGSLPHRNAEEAVALVLKAFDVPFWPQLPSLSFKELMIPQYSEGMPCVRLDEEGGKVWFERDEEEIERFYEGYDEDARIAISEDSAKGLYAFLSAVKNRHFDYLKGQVTGPVTYTLGISDRAGRPLYFDEELRELALMLLEAKARWQIDALDAHAGNIIIFIDEPVLSSLGTSAYLGVERDEALRLLSGLSHAIREAGGVPGIHCCGRADWPLVMESGVEIMNFDAYEFGDTLSIFPAETRAFLERGGFLAWGMVPTTDMIDREDEDSIIRAFRERLDNLSRQVPRELVLRQSILTPSCGTGSRTVEQTLKIFQILMRLKEEFAR